jgi:hypothetical protein
MRLDLRLQHLQSAGGLLIRRAESTVTCEIAAVC